MHHCLSALRCNVFDATPLQAFRCARRKRLRDGLFERGNVCFVQELREAQTRIHNCRILDEEVLGSPAQSRVLVGERCQEDRGLTIVVEFVVNGADWEDRALLEIQRDCSGLGEAALLDERGVDVAASDDGQEFGGAVMCVWSVHAACEDWSINLFVLRFGPKL